MYLQHGSEVVKECLLLVRDVDESEKTEKWRRLEGRYRSGMFLTYRGIRGSEIRTIQAGICYEQMSQSKDIF